MELVIWNSSRQPHINKSIFYGTDASHFIAFLLYVTPYNLGKDVLLSMSDGAGGQRYTTEEL